MLNIDKLKIPTDLYERFPKLVKVKQKFDDRKITNIERHLYNEFSKINIKNLKSKNIAVTAGSRGISNIFKIIKCILDFLKDCGAKPFVVPAMGSHGGATAEGQLEVLKSYGISEELLGYPIKSSMEVIKVGEIEKGIPVYIDKIAFEADGIVLCNRVKAHSDFKGEYESGLIKMLIIGLGNHIGASSIHQLGFENFSNILPKAGMFLLDKLNIEFGVAIVENAYDETMILEVVEKNNILQREKELLTIAKKSQAKILFDDIDILIVDEIGKNISGAGMDPNVTGRPGSGLKGFGGPKIKNIIVRDLTDESHGNAIGIGLADISTVKCLKKINFVATYTNAITATVLSSAKLPVIVKNDRDAIALAIRMSNKSCDEPINMIRIKNTLELNELWASVSYLEYIKNNKHLELISDVEKLVFDKKGYLI